MDDIIRNVKGDPGVVIKAANNLHPNLQFTIEELDSKGMGGTKNPLIPAPF